jgi:hypothetical protein
LVSGGYSSRTPGNTLKRAEEGHGSIIGSAVVAVEDEVVVVGEGLGAVVVVGGRRSVQPSEIGRSEKKTRASRKIAAKYNVTLELLN